MKRCHRVPFGRTPKGCPVWWVLPPEHRPTRLDGLPTFWPWFAQWWKPGDRRRELVKAGALILADIERLDRVKHPAEGSPS